jgi:hypothetical protein
MKYKNIAFFISLFLFSCQNEENKNTNYDYFFQITESLQFPIDSQTSYEAEMISLFDNYLVSESQKKNSIQFYDMNTKIKKHEVFLEKFGDNGVGKLIGSYVETLDSIYVMGSHRNKIYLVNQKGEVLDKLDTKYDVNGKTYGTQIGGTAFPLHKIGNVFYFTSLPHEENVMGSAMELKYDLEKREMYPSFYYPEEYNKMEHTWFFYLTKALVNKEKAVYSFSASPFLHVKEKETIRKISIQSDYAQNKILSLPAELPRDKDEYTNLYLENNIYLSIIYDKYREVYYHFFGLPIDAIDKKTGKQNTPADKPFSIIVYDKDFNKIGEYLPKENHYLHNTYFVDEKGLWISDNHVNNPNLDENKLSFRLFELVEMN